MILRGLGSLIGLLCLTLAASARADYFSPDDYVPGGAFPTGSVTIDTTAFTVNGSPWPGAGIATQTAGPDVSLFSFNGNAVIDGNVSLVGSRPAVILFDGPATLRGVWTVRSGSTADGPGDGGNSANGGGGGGGYGGIGGDGAGSPFGVGGTVYGNLLAALEAGSGGGGVLGEAGDTVVGGGGLEIGARGKLFLDFATINASGANGTPYFNKGAGGGSGGGLFLHGFDVELLGSTVTASGGQGGPGLSGFPAGGGGGGGRIAILRNASGSVLNSGSSILAPGGPVGASDYLNGTAGAGGSVVFATDPLVGIEKDKRTLLRGISLGVDTGTGGTTIQWHGDPVAFGDAGDPGFYGFLNGWGLASGDVHWFETSQRNNRVASLYRSGLEVIASPLGANSNPFTFFEISVAPYLGQALADRYGPGVSSFSELAFESPSTEFYFEGTVSVVPEPSPNLVMLAAGLLVALRHRARRA